MNLLVDSTIKVSLVIVVALGVRRLMRHRSAAVRHWVLSVAIACAAALPILGTMVPAWSVELRTSVPGAPAKDPGSVVSETTILAPAAAPQEDAARLEGRRSESYGSLLVRLAAPIWATGFGISLLLLLIGLVRLRRLAWSARQIDDGRWAELAEELGRRLNLRTRVALLMSDRSAVMGTWGLGRPRILLPDAARTWADDRARIVLSHELAHIKRGDWTIQMIAEVARAFYWFNPLVWMACARLRQESEHACDDVVLSAGIEGTDYASHLLDIARALKGQPRALLPASAMARPSSLKGRIDAMLNVTLNRNPLTRFTRITTVAALAILTTSIAGFGAQTFFTLSGTVLDPTNHALPASRLVLTNTASQAKYEIQSDRSGHFEFVGLPPGDYGLEVSLPGFSTFKDKISVIARNIDRTVQLSVGLLEETITVVGSPGGADPQPTAEQLEARQAARTRAAERQRAALEKCSETPQTAAGIGGQILAPLRVANVNPRYPENLRSAGIAGVVTMEAVIGTDGNVQEVRAVTSPHPDLESAAIEAVRQWQFTPTLLNCVPIEVRMKVTTNFKAQP